MIAHFGRAAIATLRFGKDAGAKTGGRLTND
jgi:hypothetical protein